MYVMIPSSVAWFILGFVSCIILLIIYGIYVSKKQKKKQEELLDKYLDNFVKNINDEKDDGDS